MCLSGLWLCWGKSIWHLSCFCKCWLWFWPWGAEVRARLLVWFWHRCWLTQDSCFWTLTFARSGLMRQCRKCEVAAKYQQQNLQYSLGLWLTWVPYKVPPAPLGSGFSKWLGTWCRHQHCFAGHGESYEVLWWLWSQKIVVMLAVTLASFPWEGFQYSAFVNQTAIFQSASFVRQ